MFRLRKRKYTLKKELPDGEPAVEYRGIFLNDEEPSLGGWARATFGGINSKFYEKFLNDFTNERQLHLACNVGKSIYDDDPLNGPLANEMGIIMGTSHHEPMAQAQTDWHDT
jgi:hypothetical protein